LQFEQAQHYKERLDLLESYQEKSLVANPNISDLDVCTIMSDEEFAYLNFLRIVNGCITQSQSIEVKKKLDEEDEEILTLAIVSWREMFGGESSRIMTNIAMKAGDINGAHVATPKIGDFRKLVELSLKNLMYFKKERMATKVEQREDSKKPNIAVVQLQQDLGLQELPSHIECFDNSNIQGTNPVAAMVCFKDGKPAKSEYRKFHVKTVVGPDDFASMREIVHRRYIRLLEEEKPLPKLIVIDGGKGQLSAACDSLKELGLYGQVPIIGIAKRLEEIYYPEDQVPLHISKKSPGLNLLQRIRDEAHRFAITFHRDTRSANSLGTKLDTIEGIGEKTAEKLLQSFKTLTKIKNASVEELAEIVGKDKAQKVWQGLRD
jgi:excinuclease ABC subunit C